MAYELVIFDFDGTLADTRAWFVATTNKAAIRFGFRQLSDDEFEGLRSKGNREIIAHMGVPFWKLPMIAAFMRREAEAYISEIRLFHGVEDMLAEVRATGAKIAIVTSNRERVVRGALGGNVELIDHFACGAALFGKGRKFRQLLKATSIDPRRVLAVGDEARDIEAARSAGVRAASVGWGLADPDFLKSLGPDLFFSEVAEITRTLVKTRGDYSAASAS